MQNESLEMAQVASLVLALAPGKSAKEMQAEALALIDATRSINWVTTEEREVAQKYVARLERLLRGLTSGNESGAALPGVCGSL